jgi:hypothetical protein
MFMTVGSKTFRLRRGPKRITPVGASERRAGYAVLAVLLAVAVFFLTRQASFNPAVVASLNAKQAESSKGAGQVSAELAGLLEALPGVSPLSPVEGFGPDTLSDKIDGKAELYLSSGFKQMAWRAFGPTDAVKARFDVYVYEMASKDSAFAVFSGQRRTGAAHSALAENAYTTGNALFFTSGAYYLEIVADSDSDAVKALLEPMGAALLAKLSAAQGGQDKPGAAGEVSLSDFFPKPGLIADSLRLAKSDAFGVEGFSDVYTADYKLDGAEATAFVCLLRTRPKPRPGGKNT